MIWKNAHRLRSNVSIRSTTLTIIFVHHSHVVLGFDPRATRSTPVSKSVVLASPLQRRLHVQQPSGFRVWGLGFGV